MQLPVGLVCISAAQNVGAGAAALVGDRCFVHPHESVDGALARDEGTAEIREGDV